MLTDVRSKILAGVGEPFKGLGTKDKQRLLPLLGLCVLASLHELLCLAVQHYETQLMPEGMNVTLVILAGSGLLVAGYALLLRRIPKRKSIRTALYALFPIGALALSLVMILGHHDSLIWYALPILMLIGHLYHIQEQVKWPITLGVGTFLIFAAVFIPAQAQHMDAYLLKENVLCQLSNGTLMTLAFSYLLYSLKRYENCIEGLNVAYNEEHSSANHDALTGLLNRRSFTHEMQRELARAQRGQVPLSFAMFDLDHFKQVNDVYGHPVGDEVLQELATLIRENLRTYDVLARYGGEEFALLLPHTSCLDALTLLDRLRQLVAAHLFCRSTKPLRLSISIGVAQYDPTCHDAAKLLAEADVALYAAKRNGRNQVHAAGLGNHSQAILAQRGQRMLDLFQQDETLQTAYQLHEADEKHSATLDKKKNKPETTYEAQKPLRKGCSRE